MKCRLETNEDGSMKAIDIFLGQKGEFASIRIAGEEAQTLISFCQRIKLDNAPVENIGQDTPSEEESEAEIPIEDPRRRTNPEVVMDFLRFNGPSSYGAILSELVKNGRSLSRASMHTTLNKMIREDKITIVDPRVPTDERVYRILGVKKMTKQETIMVTLRQSDAPLSTKDISKKMGYSDPSTVSDALTSLKNKGLVKKCGRDGPYTMWEAVI